MHVHDAPLPGLKIIELAVHGDARGFFVERFSRDAFAKHGLPTEFAQDNHSRSAPGILRGLHYQHAPAQGKLVGCVRGAIFDVALDIRANSPTYGQHFTIELSDTNGLLLWVPAGFAHGLCVIGSEPADVLYKVTAPYNAKGEGGIRYDDPQVGVEWPIAHPIISARDQTLATWGEYCANPVAWEA